ESPVHISWCAVALLRICFDLLFPRKICARDLGLFHFHSLVTRIPNSLLVEPQVGNSLRSSFKLTLSTPHASSAPVGKRHYDARHQYFSLTLRYTNVPIIQFSIAVLFDEAEQWPITFFRIGEKLHVHAADVEF